MLTDIRRAKNKLSLRGAIPILLRVMQICIVEVRACRRSGRKCTITPKLFNNICISLVCLCFSNSYQAFLCYQYGGFHVIVDVMRIFREIAYIQVIGIAALMI